MNPFHTITKSIRDWLIEVIPDLDGPTVHALSEQFRKDGIDTVSNMIACLNTGTLNVNDVKVYINNASLSKMRATSIIVALQNIINKGNINQV